MVILDSPLMAEFIAFLKSNWGKNSRVDQRRRRLRQLVAMVRGVADAADAAEDRAALRGGSLNAWLQQLRMEALRGQAVLDATTDASAVAGAARMLLAGIKTLFVCSREVDRLAQAVDELERLAGPGGDLDLFVKVLQLDAAPPAAMDLDAPVTFTEEEGTGSWAMSANPSPALLPTPSGIKRKRAGSSSVCDTTPESSEWQKKRRVLAWRQFPSFNALSAASRRRPVPHRAARTRTSARTVAMAMVRVRGRVGKPAWRMPPAGRSLARTALVGLSQISLQ